VVYIKYLEQQLDTINKLQKYGEHFGDPTTVKVFIKDELVKDYVLLANEVGVFFLDDVVFKELILDELRSTSYALTGKTIRVTHSLKRRRKKLI
jgi:hypothetical protein